MRSRVRGAVLVAAIPLVLVGCSDSTGTSTTITCAGGDPLCPPAGLAAGWTGPSGSPTIDPSATGTTFTVSASSFALGGSTNATGNGYWLQVTGGVLRAWGVLAVSGGTYAGDVPLFCGVQDVILSFGTGATRSYYRVTVTLTGCTTRAMRVQLIWDTGPSSDIDLHLLRPGGSMTTGNDCFYGNCTTAGGLEWGVAGAAGNPVLDVDDTEGWGPENIVISSGIEPGEYRIVVHNYDSSPATTATVKLFLNEVEVRRWTSLALDAAANRTYWEVAKVNVLTNVITTVGTYSTSPPVAPPSLPGAPGPIK